MFRLTRFLFTALLLGTVATATFAQTSEQTTTARDRQSVNITVYNSNLGLVRETRRLTLPAGRIALRFAVARRNGGRQNKPNLIGIGILLEFGYVRYDDFNGLFWRNVAD